MASEARTRSKATMARLANSAAAMDEALEAAGIFPIDGPDPTGKSWGHNVHGVTFGSQNSLPKLPLPSLPASCQRYLDCLRPLQSEQEFKSSSVAVKQFLQGEGPLLQTQLESYNRRVSNWFEHYCYQAFLGDDSSVVNNSNAFAAWPPHPDSAGNEQVARATALVRSTLQFSQAIRDDRFPLEVFRGVPQCMNQYWWLFGVTRVPCDDGGRLRMNTVARHIMVLCRGQIFMLRVLEEDSGKIISAKNLAANLRHILDNVQAISGSDASKSSIGVLTSANQKMWAHHRANLTHASITNSRNFEAIDSSLFALCLDDSVPETATAMCRNMICGTTVKEDNVQVGTCLNRWYDKLAIIVCRNGAAGMNFEHTCTDGSVDIRMACDIYSGSISPLDYFLTEGQDASALQNCDSNGHTTPNAIKKLLWDIPSNVKKGLQTAQDNLLTRLDQHQIETLKFEGYGKAFITSAGFSPDAFFQMAIHAAYFRISGQAGNGFEPVLTRHFLHGRTDVARTLTSECAAFACTFNDDKASAADKLAALRAATNAHTQNLKHCAKGYSHHRHLAVLNQLWKRKRAFLTANGMLDPSAHEEPTIFTDPGWSRLGTTNIMGSNIENPSIEYAGFGAPSPEGYTVCYYIRKNQMAMSVNSRNGKHVVYKDAIARTFQELRELIETEKQRKS